MSKLADYLQVKFRAYKGSAIREAEVLFLREWATKPDSESASRSAKLVSQLIATWAGRLFLMLLLAGIGTAEALEWSEPIQLTHHDGEYMNRSSNGVVIDANGLIHLQYGLIRAQGQEGNIRLYHTIFDRDGQILVEPTAMEFDSGLVSNAVMCETIDGNIAMIGTRPHSVYWFMTFNDSTQFDVEPHRIDNLSNPWWGSETSQYHVEHDLKRTSDGGFVYFAPIWTRFEDSVLVYAITYARLTPEGDGIDSVHVVDWFDVQGFPTEKGSLRDAWIEIDSEDNIYIVYNIAIWNVWTTRITIIAPNNEVLLRDIRTLPYLDGCESYMAQDFTLDSAGNLYIPIIDMVDSTYLHLQKLNSDLEVVWDLGLEGDLEAYGAKVAITSNRGGLFYGNSDRWDHEAFVTFNTDSGSIETREYGISTSYQFVDWYDEDFYSIYYSSGRGDGANAQFYMVKGTSPTSVESESNQLPQLLSLTSYPNPFNNGTIISYSQPNLGGLRFQIFDYSARNLREITAQSISGSAMQIYWDGRDRKGNLLPSGSYILRVYQPDGRRAISRQLTIIR